MPEKAILQTLAYSALFRFPLTKAELWQFLLTDIAITKDEFEAALKHMPKHVIHRGDYYTFTDNAASIEIRRKNMQELQKKLRIAKRAAYYLSYIPTIKLIGISGGVAIGKAEQADDIDFFIITKKHTIFMTRMWIHAILEMLNLRRKRLDVEAQDKICVNLLIDERQLAWPEGLRDVYTAHEIVHMKPLFERSDTYQAFLNHNLWVREFMPNAFEKLSSVFGSEWNRNYFTLRVMSALSTIRPFEKVAALLQKRRMKRYQTTETVTETLLAFHPYDYRAKTLADLNTKLRQLGLLTNK